MPRVVRSNYQYFTDATIQKLRAAGHARGFHSLEEGVADYVAHFLATDDAYR